LAVAFTLAEGVLFDAATFAAFVLGCGDDEGAATSVLTVGAATFAAGLLFAVLAGALLTVFVGVFMLAGTTFAAAGGALDTEAVWSFLAVASSR
jgi:hypothetical protein